MNTTSLPSINGRPLSLSVSTDFILRQTKHGKHSSSSVRGITPNSFSSSSCQSIPSGSQPRSRTTSGSQPPSRTNSGSQPASGTASGRAVDQALNKKLGTVFEQKSSRTPIHRHLIRRNTASNLNTRNSLLGDSKHPAMGRDTKPDVLNPTQSVKKAELKRIMSEPKMSTGRKNTPSAAVPLAKKLSYEKMDALMAKTRPRNGLNLRKQHSVDYDLNGRRIGATPTSKHGISGGSRCHHPATFRLGEDEFEDDDADDDSEDEATTERVLQWLEVVDREAEDPPEPDFVYEDTPPQTDSALHIVYGES